jgi:ribosomal protein S27E
MKLYPRHEASREADKGFTAEEIRKGHHWLYADVECEDCGKVQSVAMAGSTDRGKCIKCGGRTR